MDLCMIRLQSMLHLWTYVLSDYNACYIYGPLYDQTTMYVISMDLYIIRLQSMLYLWTYVWSDYNACYIYGPTYDQTTMHVTPMDLCIIRLQCMLQWENTELVTPQHTSLVEACRPTASAWCQQPCWRTCNNHLSITAGGIKPWTLGKPTQPILHCSLDRILLRLQVLNNIWECVTHKICRATSIFFINWEHSYLVLVALLQQNFIWMN